MLPERKRKAAKKRGYDVRTDSRLRHNNSTRSIPAHIRSYDNNGRSGAVTPSNTEPQQKTRLQVIHYIGTRNGHSKESDQYDRTPIFFAKTIEMSLHIIRKSKCSTDFKRNDFLKKNEAYPLGALRSLKFAYRKLRISLFVELAV